MKIKFSEMVTSNPSVRSYRQLFNLPKRRHNYGIDGKKIDLPEDAKLNMVVFNAKADSNEVKEKVLFFHGNKLLLSDYQRRLFSKVLQERLDELGKRIFDSDSSFNLIAHSSDIKVKGSYNWIENDQVLNTKQEEPKKEKVQSEARKPFIRKYLTASQIRDHDICPERLWKDTHLPEEEHGLTNSFIQLLWEKGIQFESKVIVELGDYEDLSEGDLYVRARRTIDAMKNGVRLIYKGVLIAEPKIEKSTGDSGAEVELIKEPGLLSEPDLLLRREDGSYIPIEVRAAMAFESGEDAQKDGKLKEEYAKQLALHVEALMRLGFSKEKKGIIFDNEGRLVEYDLTLPKNSRNKKTWWQVYEESKEEAYKIIRNELKPGAALFSGCKLCWWYKLCKSECQENQHPTLVYGLGRTYTDILRRDAKVETLQDLANLNIDQLLAQKAAEEKGFLSGIGEKRLETWARRAQYMNSGQKGAKILSPISFPNKERELHLDIESDPTQKHNFVYLHGIVERIMKDNKTRFLGFVAKDVEDDLEKKAWQELWTYLRALPDDYVVYHYSHYERTVYNKLRERYPDVATQEEVDKLFHPDRCVDLFKVVDTSTDWPLTSYSLKDIAKHIGFSWRDTDPSGASSIQWFNKWLITQNEEDWERILKYNEDDCRATVALKDYLVEKMKEYVQGLEKQLEKPKRFELPVLDNIPN